MDTTNINKIENETCRSPLDGGVGKRASKRAGMNESPFSVIFQLLKPITIEKPFMGFKRGNYILLLQVIRKKKTTVAL